MAHRHDWHWIGDRPEQGERCACGKTRDIQVRLPTAPTLQEKRVMDPKFTRNRDGR